MHSLNDNVDDGGKLADTRIPINGDGVAGRVGSGTAVGSHGLASSARGAKRSPPDDGAESEGLYPKLALPLSRETQPQEPEGQ
jgi:hypothetical protein